MNVRDETRHDIHKSAALRFALLCIVTRLISDIHFHINRTNINIQFLNKTQFNKLNNNYCNTIKLIRKRFLCKKK